MEYDEVSDFVAYLQLKNLSPRTIVEDKRVLASFFDHVALGDLAPREITTAQLRDYVAGLQQRGPGREDYQGSGYRHQALPRLPGSRGIHLRQGEGEKWAQDAL